MAEFRFKAMNAKGRIIRNHIEANNIDDLEARLARIDLDLINCWEEKKKKTRISARQISTQEMITLCLHMEQVTHSGIPLLGGFSDLRDSSENPSMKALIGSVIENIESGLTLTEALEKFPQIFDKVFLALIRAGESTGELSIIFASLANNYKWLDEIRSRTKKVLLYPTFVLVIVSAVFFFMMTFLVPQVVQLLTTMGMELPFHTKMLIATSHFIVAHWLILIMTPISFIIFIIIGIRISPSLAYGVDFIKLRLWIFGPLLLKISLARFANIFAIMYSSGITVLECVLISEEVMGNRFLAKVMQEVHQMISEGQTITESFKKSMIFPPLVLRMISVGESTGSLHTGLLNVKYFYERDVKDGVDKIQGMIEPILTLFLGGLLAWIILSVMGPVYDIIQKVGK
ncbi:MAG: type II secretion system F family protein [Magnetococcus sp. DMHC-6]